MVNYDLGVVRNELKNCSKTDREYESKENGNYGYCNDIRIEILYLKIDVYQLYVTPVNRLRLKMSIEILGISEYLQKIIWLKIKWLKKWRND